MLFSFASKVQKTGISIVAGEAYSADLFGAALGALLISALIIPLLGLVNAAIIAGSLCFVSGIVTLIRRKT
jgi:predicted membrane-bound spermidine synthase